MPGDLAARIRFGAAAAFLAAQAALVVHSQFIEERDFCWAPHTTQVAYSIVVDAGGRRLADDETSARYGLRQYGWEAHSAANLLALVRQCEETYRRDEHARVEVTYRINGGPAQVWNWPGP